MKIIQRALLSLTFLVTLSAQSNDLSVFSNVDLNITRISNVDDVGFGLGIGTDLVWHFSQNVGLFVGADYAQLKGEEKGESVQATYLDIPFGISFGQVAGPNASRASVINLGLYYGLPLGKLKVGSHKIETSSVLGLNLEFHNTFKVTEGFHLGLHFLAKYGFQNIVDPKDNPLGTSSKTISTGIGLSAKFL
jgi:hypothetical protein